MYQILDCLVADLGFAFLSFLFPVNSFTIIIITAITTIESAGSV